MHFNESFYLLWSSFLAVSKLRFCDDLTPGLTLHDFHYITWWGPLIQVCLFLNKLFVYKSVWVIFGSKFLCFKNPWSCLEKIKVLENFVCLQASVVILRVKKLSLIQFSQEWALYWVIQYQVVKPTVIYTWSTLNRFRILYLCIHKCICYICMYLFIYYKRGLEL